MPRFAVLTHDHPFLHWDLLLEAGPACRTWRLHQPPDSGGEIVAEPLPDHRLMYLDYEGPISGHRGQVTRWDGGDYSLIEQSETTLTIQVHGARLAGVLRLQRDDPPPQWRCLFET